MAHHHYILQYHLYAAALHRMLRHRLPAYDPARHWGGVHYLFLRGMVPWSPPGNGVHSDAMSPALLEGLSEVLERSSP
jgi:exodeoxyribonuclease V beta subunit